MLRRCASRPPTEERLGEAVREGAVNTKDKDGKDEKKELNICLTHHERLDGNTGMVLVSAAVRADRGPGQADFMVMVPLGMLLPAGHARRDLPQGAVGEGAEEREDRRDQDSEGRSSSSYTLCHPAGCTAEMEATA